MPRTELSSAKASVDSRGPRWGTLAPGVAAAGALLPALVAACVPEGPPTKGRERGSATPPSMLPLTLAEGEAPEGEERGEDDPRLSEPFSDDFERDEIGDRWRALSPAWRIEKGELCARGAKNRGVWLKRRLPPNARIEVDARSDAPEGDIKVELWGDGRSGATGDSYDDASGYIAILGGWSNRLHVLARRDEHGDDRHVTEVQEGGDPAEAPVVAGRTYRLRFERRDGETLRWWVDDVPMHRFADPRPLHGAGHDHVGFNDWMAPVCFDNLEITPL